MNLFSALVTGLLLAAGSASCQSNATSSAATMSTSATKPAVRGSVHDFTVPSLAGQQVSLSQYKGKKMLIVNTASECGYTPQYKGLEELSKARAGKLVVVAFPSNQFGGQEPGTAQEIAAFCEKNYGVSFPMMAKSEVKGDGATPLYQYLKQATGEEPGWNFCKYLVDENGKVLKFYSSKVEPMSEELLADIDRN